MAVYQASIIPQQPLGKYNQDMAGSEAKQTYLCAILVLPNKMRNP